MENHMVSFTGGWANNAHFVSGGPADPPGRKLSPTVREPLQSNRKLRVDPQRLGAMRILFFAGWATIFSALSGGLGGCGSSAENAGGNPDASQSCNVTITEKTGAQTFIQSLDVDPQPAEAISALKAGCAASETDINAFMAGFLCALEIDPSFATDSDIQNNVDNWDHIDTSDLPGSCAVIDSL